MLVFTITNNITEEVWVGTCKDSSDERFDQLQEAMALGIKAQIYKDLRDFGVQNFTVEDFAIAEDREELKDLFEEAMEENNGKSLIGIKTSLGKTSIASTAPLKSSVGAYKRPSVSTPSRATSSTISRAATTTRRVTGKPVKEKIASGRTNNSVKEKLIKEKMADEKAHRESLKSKQVMEQADEMAAIMARLDSRGSTAGKR
ncbi:MAG: GIY-YIG nuclease family protein [Bermanella sp.]